MGKLKPITPTKAQIVANPQASAHDYDNLTHKPQINGHELVGNKSSDDLGLQGKLTAAEKTAIATEAAGMISVPTKTSELQNDSGFLTQHQDISGKADKLSHGNDNELVDAAGNGTMKRSGYKVTTNKNVITDADSANGFVPNARSVAKVIEDVKALIPSAVDGKSAYDIAVEHGYDGTEEEWLEYLVGIKRAYISAQDGNLYVVKPGRYYRDDDGDPGSEPDVHLRLGRVVGTNGQNGSGYSDAEIDSNGDLIIKEIRGDGAYGFVNLGHVVGADGQNGAKGDKGDKGDKGATGAAGADWVPTEQELDGIADRVIAKLPTTQGVLYGNTSN